jgi:spore coat polysaccharide biosynthesis predicted glycosyltransferase SpsG
LPITIITEGSLALGTGHLRRSATLARSLARATQVRIWILDEHAPTPDLERWFDGLPLEAGAEPRLERGDVAILDLEQPSHTAMWSRCASAGVTTLALDYCDPTQLPDLTINLIDHSGAMRAAYATAGRPADYREGPEYALIRPTILERRSPVPADVSVKHVVVTMGGADPAAQSLEAVKSLNWQSGGFDTVTVIFGPLAPRDLEAAVRAASPDAAIIRNPANFAELLSTADLVLTSGGGTLLESLYLGKPTVVFPQNTAESAHAERYVQAGACVWAGSLPQVIAEAGLRRSLAETAAQMVDGRGVERIAVAALELERRAAHA